MSRIARPCLCLVTDRHRLSPDARTTRDETAALARWLDEAIDAGVDLVHIRERDLAAGVLRDLTAAVAARAHGTCTAVVVNDRADVAIVSGAAGVHLRADGPPVDRVRAFGPADWIIGRSIHGPDEARIASAADYLVFGTAFPSASKMAGAPVQGIDGLRAAIEASPVPVLAIGGITLENAPQCAAAGASGVAAIGLFLPEGRHPGAIGITRAVRGLRAAL